MKNKGFTLTEIIIVLIVVAILASVAVPIYQNALNQQELRRESAIVLEAAAAAEIDAMKNDDIMAGDFAMIWHKYGNEVSVAICKRQAEKKGYLSLAYSFVKNIKCFLADIVSLNMLYADGGRRIPPVHGADHIRTSRSGVRYTYRIHPAAAEKKWSSLGDNAIIVTEASAARTAMAYPHKQGIFGAQDVGMFVTKNKKVYTISSKNGLGNDVRDAPTAATEWRS